MNKLNVAVIGSGAMGKSHVRVYSDMDKVELVALCDINKDAREIADSYKIKYYQDYNEMLAKEKLDAISICVPTKLHKKVAIDIISNKVNVLVEKPIATTKTEAEIMINEAEKNNVKLMIGHIERFNPVIAELKKRIDGNELGKIYKVNCVRQSPFPKRIVDVGVIIDLAIHEIDVLKHIVPSEMSRVYAETAQKIHSSHEDLLIGTIRFENNILGVINANWLTPKKVREISVTGEKGMFVANYITQELYFYENEFASKNYDYNSNFMNVIEGKMVKIDLKNEEPLANELKSFVKCIIEGTEPKVSGKDGLNALKVAQKLIESSKENKVMML